MRPQQVTNQHEARKTMRQKSLLAFPIGAVIVTLIILLSRFSGVRQVADESVQLGLNVIGSSIYEYHALMGKWPTRNEDLAKTSLPLKYPHWRYLLDHQLVVIVWHKAMEPDPKANSHQILAYYKKGLISEFRKNWVCWGDLRTEYIKTEDLRAYLKNLED